MPPRMSSRRESASCAGLEAAVSAAGARLMPPAATAAAFLANMLARRCLSRLSTSGFLARLASLESSLPPFLRFLPSASASASSSSSSSSDMPGCALVQSSSSPRST